MAVGFEFEAQSNKLPGRSRKDVVYQDAVAGFKIEADTDFDVEFNIDPQITMANVDRAFDAIEAFITVLNAGVIKDAVKIAGRPPGWQYSDVSLLIPDQSWLASVQYTEGLLFLK